MNIARTIAQIRDAKAMVVRLRSVGDFHTRAKVEDVIAGLEAALIANALRSGRRRG